MNCSKEHGLELVQKYWKREWEKIKLIPEVPSCREFVAPESRLLNEFKNLQLQAEGKLERGNKGSSEIIYKFHPSIVTANKGGYDSPTEYWKKLQQDPELFKKFLLNRYTCSDWYNEKDKSDPEHKRTNRHYLEEGYLPAFIASIGLTTGLKAPKVSIFSPRFTVNLIKEHLSEYTEIFDPFSGYSGRMLGTLAFKDKKYIGRDLNDITIKEEQDVYTRLNNNFPDTIGRADLTVADAFTNKGKYQCLLTCGPYDDGKGKQVEEWMSSKGKISCKFGSDEVILKCLKNYECEKYVFVTNETSKMFDDYIKGYQTNHSYIQARASNGHKAGSNQEKIIVLTLQERNKFLNK